ncbi:MAG: J domain-containing protein [Desulfomonilaceae bacterium]
MNLNDQILKFILDEPGASIERLCGAFNLTEYRLKRIFRNIENGLRGRTIVHHHKNGVWIVEVDSERCLGIDWMEHDNNGYIQCGREPEFPDARCWHHSGWENPELIAFERRLSYLTGPTEPNPYSVSHLSMTEVDELFKTLNGILPATLLQQQQKKKFMSMLLSALAILRWKYQMRGRRTEQEIPREFADRHRRSSINTFEFSLQRHFQVLELSPDSTKQDVMKAWRRLARRFHPDTIDGDEERMKIINLAKERIFYVRGWD